MEVTAPVHLLEVAKKMVTLARRADLTGSAKKRKAEAESEEKLKFDI